MKLVNLECGINSQELGKDYLSAVEATELLGVKMETLYAWPVIPHHVSEYFAQLDAHLHQRLLHALHPTLQQRWLLFAGTM